MRWFRSNVLLTALALMSAHRNNPAGSPTPEELAKALREVLSPTAKVYLPNSTEFEVVSTRWSVLEVPTVNIAVVPATEDDVAETVSLGWLPFTFVSFQVFLVS